MPTIWCYNEHCIHCKNDNCIANVVEVNEDGECDTFENYLDTEEYRQKFYIAVKTENGICAKAVKYGKKLDINGVTFYTQSPPNESEEYIRITHGRTGYRCLTVSAVKAKFDLFIKRQEQVQSVHELPLAEYDARNREYYLVNEESA